IRNRQLGLWSRSGMNGGDIRQGGRRVEAHDPQNCALLERGKAQEGRKSELAVVAMVATCRNITRG
ncbi:hypothetical protein, partial [Schlesneria sp.]|uniref:hypothetical protein n=1 Tax=Schlesneria sp. TaxID=2762018 RepID=UPI002F134721